ncbi:MAG: response regulator [Bdellovibrionota bacterium]
MLQAADSSSGKKILVVEDDRLARAYIQEGLQDLPHQLVFATNGLEGLQLFQQSPPDLILVDVLLPKMSGFDLCQNIRSQPPGQNVPILFMSAVYKSLAVQNEAKVKYGATDFLTKPLNLNLLRERISVLLHTDSPTPIAEQPDAETEVSSPSVDTAEGRAGEEAQGDLEREPFASVFFKIHRHGETGALHLRRGKVRKTLYFQEGVPVFVQSNLLNETLAKLLVSLGRLSQQQIDDTRLIAKQRNRLHGQVLVDLKLLTAEELATMLALQHQEKILSVFSWGTGNYVFARGAIPPRGVELHRPDTPVLFTQGVLERVPFEFIRDRMAPLAEHFPVWLPLPLQPLAAFRLPPEARVLLAQIDGAGNLKRTLQGVHQPDFLLRLIYLLAISGNLRLAETPAPEEIEATRQTQKELAGARDVERSPKAEEEFSLVERIARKYTTLETDDYFQVLEITRTASGAEVREAYLRLAKLFHPEKVGAAVDPSSRDKVEAIYVKVTTAYEVLSDEDDRTSYESKLADR